MLRYDGPAKRVVIGFRDHHSSLAALRWAIHASHETDLPLVVIHATDIGVSVRNGPSSSVAHRLGSPLWASVHSLVQGLSAPVATETIIETGTAPRVFMKHVTPDDLVVLGPRSRMPGTANLGRRLAAKHGCEVKRISSYQVETAPQLTSVGVSSSAVPAMAATGR